MTKNKTDKTERIFEILIIVFYIGLVIAGFTITWLYLIERERIMKEMLESIKNINGCLR